MPANLQMLQQRLETFLSEGRLKEVHFASGDHPPPPLAYLVNFPRLSVTLSGVDAMWLEHAEHSARVEQVPVGTAVFVPANAWNKPLWHRPVEVISLLFGHKQTGVSLVRHDGCSRVPGGALKSSLEIPALSPVRDLLRVLSTLSAPSSAAPALVESLLHCCLAEMKSPDLPVRRKARRSYEDVCLYIQEHFPFPLTRDSVAEHFRISPNHISRLFHSEGHVSFNDYLNYVRIDRAKYLLMHHKLTIDELTARCGYREAAYFCRVFKEKTRMTPTEYRLKNGR
ncbi:MAG TPA: helix-turn-helix transcriptional regulator [Chthoniobacterales bacterium]|jgi:AraC-like DNA-binding protein